MREYEEGYPVDANDRYYQGYHSDPDRRNNSNFGFANVKRNAVLGGNKVREDATDYLNERLKVMPYESTEVLFDQRVEFEGGEALLTAPLGLVAGETYKVTFDGESLDLVAQNYYPDPDSDFIAGVFIGDMTDELFFIVEFTPEAAADIGFLGAISAPAAYESTSATVKIEKSVIHTIDPKFLPGGGVLLYADDSGCLYKSDVLSEENAVSMDEVLGYAKKGMTVVVTPYTLVERTAYLYATTINKITYEEPNYAQVCIGGDSYYHSKERVVNAPSPV